MSKDYIKEVKEQIDLSNPRCLHCQSRLKVINEIKYKCDNPNCKMVYVISPDTGNVRNSHRGL
jgi:hypothetical protein